MALLTALSTEQTSEILAGFGLGPVAGLEPIARGSVNSNFRIRTLAGTELFLRIFEEQGVGGAARETRLLEHLAARGVRTPAPLTTPQGQGHVVFDGKAVALFPWIEGDELCQARVTAAASREVGNALAGVHLAGEGFAGCGPGRFEAPDLVRRLEGIPVAAVPEGQALLDELRQDLAEDLPDLPAGVIHGDLFRDNVLWQGDRIAALLDFESASEGLFAYDLSVTLLAWTYGDGFDPALVRALVEGYASVRPLEPEERRAFPRLARRAATRFAITRITDFHLRPASQGGACKDYRRFVARRDAITTQLAPLLR